MQALFTSRSVQRDPIRSLTNNTNYFFTFMKINTKQGIKDLKGDVLKDASGEDFTIGGFLANQLIIPRETPIKGLSPIKAWSLAQKFYNEDEVELDKADALVIKDMVEAIEGISPMVTAQILETLE